MTGIAGLGKRRCSAEEDWSLLNNPYDRGLKLHNVRSVMIIVEGVSQPWPLPAHLVVTSMSVATKTSISSSLHPREKRKTEEFPDSLVKQKILNCEVKSHCHEHYQDRQRMS